MGIASPKTQQVTVLRWARDVHRGSLVLEVSPRAKLRVSSDRSFGAVFALVSFVLAFEPLLLRNHRPRLWLLCLGGFLACLAWWKPESMAVPNRLWLRFGAVLGGVVSELVMLAIFAAVVIPTGLVLRVFRRGPFDRRNDRTSKTNWKIRGQDVPTMGTMRNQF